MKKIILFFITFFFFGVYNVFANESVTYYNSSSGYNKYFSYKGVSYYFIKNTSSTDFYRFSDNEKVLTIDFSLYSLLYDSGAGQLYYYDGASFYYMIDGENSPFSFEKKTIARITDCRYSTYVYNYKVHCDNTTFTGFNQDNKFLFGNRLFYKSGADGSIIFRSYKKGDGPYDLDFRDLEIKTNQTSHSYVISPTRLLFMQNDGGFLYNVYIYDFEEKKIIYTGTHNFKVSNTYNVKLLYDYGCRYSILEGEKSVSGKFCDFGTGAADGAGAAGGASGSGVGNGAVDGAGSAGGAAGSSGSGVGNGAVDGAGSAGGAAGSAGSGVGNGASNGAGAAGGAAGSGAGNGASNGAGAASGAAGNSQDNSGFFSGIINGLSDFKNSVSDSFSNLVDGFSGFFGQVSNSISNGFDKIVGIFSGDPSGFSVDSNGINYDNVGTIKTDGEGFLSINSGNINSPVLEGSKCKLFNENNLTFLYYSNGNSSINFSLRNFGFLDNQFGGFLDFVSGIFIGPLNNILAITGIITPFNSDNQQVCLFGEVKTIKFHKMMEGTDYYGTMTFFDYLVIFVFGSFIFFILGGLSFFKGISTPEGNVTPYKYTRYSKGGYIVNDKYEIKK